MRWQSHDYDQLVTTSIAVVLNINNVYYKLFLKKMFAEKIYQGKKVLPPCRAALPCDGLCSPFPRILSVNNSKLA